MRKTIASMKERLFDGADLVINFATLGEYGYQPTEPECRRELCAPGRTHGSTALERRAERLERFAA